MPDHLEEIEKLSWRILERQNIIKQSERRILALKDEAKVLIEDDGWGEPLFFEDPQGSGMKIKVSIDRDEVMVDRIVPEDEQPLRREDNHMDDYTEEDWEILRARRAAQEGKDGS